MKCSKSFYRFLARFLRFLIRGFAKIIMLRSRVMAIDLLTWNAL